MQNLGTSCFATSWAKLCINDIFFPEEPSKNKFVCITYQSVYLPLKKKKIKKNLGSYFFLTSFEVLLLNVAESTFGYGEEKELRRCGVKRLTSSRAPC